MKPAIHDASARQHSGGPSPVRGRGGNGNDRARKPRLVEVEAEIAGLLDRSTQELRLVWRQLHRAGPPVGLSRDLLIRALAYDLHEPLPMICKSVPMAAPAPHCGAACRAWPKRQTKALW